MTVYTSNRVHIELHYTLMEEGLAKAASDVLRDVWSRTQLREGWAHWRLLDAETFYFYHIAHLAKHFERGGSGVRSFMDLWIMERSMPIDPEARDALLEAGELRIFSEASARLSKVWFASAPMDDVSAQMEQFVLRGGVYGARENRIAVEQERKGGRWAYLRSKIFLTHEDLKYQYPILCRHRWLTPLMQVRRWCRLVFCGHAKRSLREIRYSAGLTEAELKETARFMQRIGL